jgi:predicted ferric reductase
MNSSTLESQRPKLVLAQPTKRIKLGFAKHVKLKRAQDVIEAVAWSTVVAVVVMFLVDGGLTNITDIASGLGAFSRLSSLVATDLLLIHMLLVARVPWIDKFYGHDRATLAHKKLGKPVLYIIVAHFLASLIQFAILDGKNIVDELLSMMSITDLLLAVISLALMVLVVVTSLNIARKKLSYEAWFIVHLLSYIAVGIAVPHVFSMGSDVAGKPVQTVFWVTLYLFVALNLIWYRVLQPIVSSARAGLRIENVVRESSDSVSIYVGGNDLSELSAQSGQFYLLRILTATQWWRPHPFSISAAPNNNHVRFTVGNRGDDTALLQHMRPGARVILEGPYGVFTEERRTREKVVLIASGIGVPPVRALAESMAARPGDLTIIYRVRDENDAALLGELRHIAQVRQQNLHVIAGPRGSANSWLNADAYGRSDQMRLKDLAPHIADSDVYVCGPEGWTHSVKHSATSAGVPEHQIHSEEYAW